MAKWQEPVSLVLERWFQKRQDAFVIISIMLGILVMVVSWLGRTPGSEEFTYFFISIAKGIGLILLVIGIPWFLVQIREAFHNIQPQGGESARELLPVFQSHFSNWKSFCAIIAFLLIPVIFIIWVKVFTNFGDFIEGGFFNHPLLDYLGITVYEISQFNWRFICWIFTEIPLNFLFFYFLGIILWMLLGVILTLKDAKGDSRRKRVPIDILAADGIGGLGPVQAVMRSLITYYSIVVTLVLIIPQYSFHYQQKSIIEGFLGFPSLVMIAILFVGVLFFYFGFGLIQDLVRGQVNEVIEDLNKQIRSRSTQMKERISTSDTIEIEKLKEEDFVLDIFYKEKDRLLVVYNRNTAYDTRTIAQSIVSLLIPIIVFLQSI